ncbi:unnamed protein product [Closterium sp. NIES-64]|nr:unnamed protein product [Closterium sp. NIES-64]
MADEQLAVGDDTITDLGDYVLEDLPDGALPELNGEPAAKKQCGEGTSSGSAGPSTSTAAPPASQPMRRSNSSGSSATTAPSSPRPAVPPRPRSAPPSRPQPPVQEAAGKLLGQNAATAAFKKHPGLVLIGLDLDVEVWACSVCDYECGIALESAMFHINSDSHRTKLQDSAHLNATKDKYGAWKAETMVQHHRIKALLQ